MQWFIRHAICAIFPLGGPLPGVDPAHLKTLLARTMRESPPLFRLGLWVAALIFHLSPLVTIFVPLPAFFLPKSLLDKHADRLMTHRWYHLRMLCYTLKFMGGVAWGMQPDVREAVHVRPFGPDPGTFQTGEVTAE